MKLKKVSRVLSLVVAGAMVLAMAPAAFAVTVGNFDYDVVDSTHHKVIFRNPNGLFEDCGIHPCSFGKDGKCICGNACSHVGAQNVVDNGDGTHNVVCPTCNKVVDTAKHSYNENGQCACGATCNHMGQHFKFDANNNRTHNVLCADCDAVVSENVPCTYVDGKCQQCDATQPAPEPTPVPEPTPDPEPTPGSSVGPVATTIGLGIWLLILGGLILGFFGL